MMKNLKLARWKLAQFHWLVLAFALGTTVKAAADPFPVITYYFELNESTWRSATVNITIENNSHSRLLCTLPEVSGAAFQSIPVPARVSRFEVTAEGVKDPTFQKVNAHSWLIYTNGNRTIIISYRISNLQNSFLGNYLNRSYALVDNPAVFMMIRELKDFPVKLTISVPYGWKLATGLPFAGDNFEYNALNYEQLSHHPLFLAPFEEIYFNYYDQIHFVLFNKNPSRTLSDKLSALSQKIFRYQSGFFQEIPKDRYFYIFNFLRKKNPVMSQTYENGSIFFLPRKFDDEAYPQLQKEIGSSFFRHWIRSICLSDQNTLAEGCRLKNLWFWLGVTDYYSALFLVHSKEWTADYFVDHYVDRINQYLKSQREKKTPITNIQLTGQGSDLLENYNLLRLKGELLCAILDLKIRDVTQNRKSLDDIIKFVRRWAGSHDGQMIDSNFQKIINSVTSIDFTTFFDLYIDGVIDLPFVDTLEKAGLFVEFYQDTIPDLGNIAIENNIITEFEQYSPLSLAGVKKGDKIIAVNQFQLDRMIDVKTLCDSLRVGKGNELMVSREGLSLLLSLDVPGRKIQQLRLVSKEPRTDFQAAIRKSWLKQGTN